MNKLFRQSETEIVFFLFEKVSLCCKLVVSDESVFKTNMFVSVRRGGVSNRN